MKQIHIHIAWMLLVSSTVLCAETPSSELPEPVDVTYLENEAYLPEAGYVVVRSAFEIAGPAHRWVALDVEFRLTQAIPLVRSDEKVFMKRWNNLFLPETPHPVRWTDCRLDVDFREFEEAKNLPKDQTFVVWAMGLIYDHAAGKHVGSGWPVRVPLVMTTDANGKIQRVVSPAIPPIQYEYPSDKTIPVRQAEVNTKHLIPLPGLMAYQVLRRDGKGITILTSPKGQLWKPADFGGAFEPIDSAEKARELVQLMHPGAVIVATREQYDAVITTARKLGWKAETLPPDVPPSLGLHVTPIEGLGWRVEALLLEPRSKDGQLGDLVAWDYYITPEGEMSAKHYVLLHSPTKKNPAPVSEDVYSSILWAHLGGLSPATITPIVVPTDTIVPLPLPARMTADRFVSPEAAGEESADTPPQPTTAPAPQANPAEPADTITTTGPTPIRKP